MAFFKFRWPGRGGQDDSSRSVNSRHAPSTESVDALRRRARHRLIGAAVLLAAGVVGFPVLFDTQPRPIPVDIPIAIPDRNQAPALVLPGAQSGQDAPVNVAQAPASPAPTAAPRPAAAPKPPVSTPPASAPAAAAPATAARNAAGLDAGEEVIASSPRKPPVPAAAPKPETKPEAKPKPEPKPAEPKPKPEPKAETRPDAKPSAAQARADDAARARALLEGRSEPAPSAAAAAPAAAAEGRFVVQVGAFSDMAKAQEARNKLAHSGLKTYMQSVDTKDGKRHRVRVGPFASRAEADKAAGRVKGLDLPASVLTL